MVTKKILKKAVKKVAKKPVKKVAKKEVKKPAKKAVEKETVWPEGSGKVKIAKTLDEATKLILAQKAAKKAKK